MTEAERTTEAKRMSSLFTGGPILLEQALPGSKCLDVSTSQPSKHDVSYVHDALYDVALTYQYRGLIKRVVLPFGFTGGVTVVPTTSQIVIADDSAEIVHKLKAAAPERAR